MKILPTGITKRIEYVQSVIRLDCPRRGQATVSEPEAVLEIHAACVVQAPGNRKAVRFRPVAPVIQISVVGKVSSARDIAGQCQCSGIYQSSKKVRVADGQIAGV